ncbi:MAG TPA: ABC transporter permease [Candidatus Nanoarchaeia archaeon]
MSPRRVFAIAKRIIRQFVHDRRTVGLIVVVPILLLSILGALFKTTQVFEAGLVNQDQGVATPLGFQRISQKALDSLEGSESLTWHKLSLEEAKKDLEEGSLDAYVLLPKDFSQSVTEQKKPQITIALEGSDPNISQQTLGLINQNLARALAGQQLAEIKVEYLYGGEEFTSLDYFAPVFIAFFAFFFVFLLTSVSFLRERAQGTIERLFASPVNNAEIVLGYFLGFLIFATVQSLIVLLFTIYVLDVHFIGNIWFILLIELILVVGSVNMGIFLSAFAKNELQVVQFMPLIIVPQGLLSGLIWPIKSMPPLLQWISYAMPLTYANDALRGLMIRGAGLSKVSLDIYVLVAFALLMIFLAGLSIRRGV